MRLDVRVPVHFSHSSATGRGLSTSLSLHALAFEAASFNPPPGATIEMQIELVGSDRRVTTTGPVNTVTDIPGRAEKLISVGPLQAEPEDARSYSAWMTERAPLVARAVAQEDLAAKQVRGAVFEVSADFSEVIVGWPTRAAYAKSFREEIARNLIRVRSAARGTVGKPVAVAFLVPQGAPVRLNAKIATLQGGEAELALEIPPEAALKLASWARG
ncbi:MAG: hypothetical protein FJ102_26885 [Deltaproteobacteria bacterium]|nr:hypothetical protein [Deltaproteobacteria bacterium]